MFLLVLKKLYIVCVLCLWMVLLYIGNINELVNFNCMIFIIFFWWFDVFYKGWKLKDV